MSVLAIEHVGEHLLKGRIVVGYHLVGEAVTRLKQHLLVEGECRDSEHSSMPCGSSM